MKVTGVKDKSKVSGLNNWKRVVNKGGGVGKIVREAAWVRGSQELSFRCVESDVPTRQPRGCAEEAVG